MRAHKREERQKKSVLFAEDEVLGRMSCVQKEKTRRRERLPYRSKSIIQGGSDPSKKHLARLIRQ